MRCLVVGGAGYVGSVVVRALLADHHGVVVLERLLLTGHASSVPDDVELVRADLTEAAQVLRENDFDAVLHFAAKSLVGESDGQPVPVLADQRVRHPRPAGCDHRPCRGTAAGVLINRGRVRRAGRGADRRDRSDHAHQPVRREQAGRRHDDHRGVRRVLDARRGEPALLQRRRGSVRCRPGEEHRTSPPDPAGTGRGHPGNGRTRFVFGDDKPTPDGTPIRDYVHVADTGQGPPCSRWYSRQPRHQSDLQPRQRRRLLGQAGAGRRGTGDGAAGPDDCRTASSRRSGEVGRLRRSRPHRPGLVPERDLDHMVGDAWEFVMALPPAPRP